MKQHIRPFQRLDAIIVYSQPISIYERVKAAKLSPKEYAKGVFNVAIAIQRENFLFPFQRSAENSQKSTTESHHRHSPDQALRSYIYSD